MKLVSTRIEDAVDNEDYEKAAQYKQRASQINEELTKLKVKDYCQQRRGVAHLQVQGKGGKMRFVPTHPGTLTLIEEYLEAVGHRQDLDALLFRPVKNNVHGHTSIRR